MASDDPQGGRRLDAVAVARARRRIAGAAEPPWLHGEIARRIGERLQPIRVAPKRVVEWWPEVGAAKAMLQLAYPKAQQAGVAAERSAGGHGRRERRWWERRRAEASPALRESDDDVTIGSADVVCANMMLHFVADPPALFARWHRLLATGGLAVFSCPGPATLRDLASLYAEAGWPAPMASFVDMHDLGDMLVAAGFAEPVLDQETLTLRWKSADALLAELRSLGGNTSPDRHPALRTPRWKRALVERLARRAESDGGVALRFEIAYGHGFKAGPKAGPGEPVAISLDALRASLGRRRGSGDPPGSS